MDELSLPIFDLTEGSGFRCEDEKKGEERRSEGVAW